VGPGIGTISSQGMSFDKFYRGKDQRYLVRETGMGGWPIAKGARHRATRNPWSDEPNFGHGSVFSFSWPVCAKGCDQNEWTAANPGRGRMSRRLRECWFTLSKQRLNVIIEVQRRAKGKSGGEAVRKERGGQTLYFRFGNMPGLSGGSQALPRNSAISDAPILCSRFGKRGGGTKCSPTRCGERGTICVNPWIPPKELAGAYRAALKGGRTPVTTLPPLFRRTSRSISKSGITVGAVRKCHPGRRGIRRTSKHLIANRGKR